VSLTSATPTFQPYNQNPFKAQFLALWSLLYAAKKSRVLATTQRVKEMNITLESATTPDTMLPNMAMLKLPTSLPRLPDCVDSKPAQWLSTVMDRMP
jgi:hypothetical protein